jgi:arylsulfatase A-like enzyme
MAYTSVFRALALALAVSVTGYAKPNIVFIMSDDVGYGDLGVYGATKVKTPNLDRLASQGMRFTNAHATASTCSPSRYSFLTGVYPWRPPALANGILEKKAKLSIAVSQPTVASLLKAQGYATAVIGKWHLGLGSGNVDYNKDITPGPNEIGFDYSFIVPVTPDRVPCVYIENHKVYGLDPADPIVLDVQGSEPTGKTNPEMLAYPPAGNHDGTIIDSVSRIGFMNGGKKARWKDGDMADTLAARAVKFIADNKAKPFFLYFAQQNVHVPRRPHPRFRGTSQCGIRCDALAEMDWSAGRIMAVLDSLGLADSTLLIFSSDNGGVLEDGYLDGSIDNANGHLPNGELRGGKYSIYEGGARMPFLVRWPGKVKAGSVSDQLICQIDMLATAAAMLGIASPPAALDSKSMLPTLLSGGKDPSRSEIVVQSNGAAKMAILSGDWKYVAGSGELYNLKTDLPEKTNIAAQNAAKAAELKAALDKVKGQTVGFLPVAAELPPDGFEEGFFLPSRGAHALRVRNGDGLHGVDGRRDPGAPQPPSKRPGSP